MTDIPQYATFAKIEPLNKGWSSDKKYYIETHAGERLLLRIADIAERERKLAEFEMLKRVAELDVPASRPIDFGECSGGKSVYQLLTWIDGEDSQTVLPTLSEAEQYALGVKAGEILRKMQTLQTTPMNSEWLNAYGAKIDRYIENYKNCGLTFWGDDTVIAYLEENRHLLDNRAMCFTHDDYHLGNLILSPENKLFVIDFQRFRMVEPYHALSGLVFSAKTSPHFATGEIHGYFGGEPSQNFWQLLALYTAAIAVNGLPYALSLKDHENTTLQAELDFAYKQIADIMRWYDNFNRVVPSWYLGDIAEVRTVTAENLPEYADVIRRSFLTVAQDFGWTRETAPGFRAYITDEELLARYVVGYTPFALFAGGKIAGFVSLTDKGGGVFVLNLLSVAPEYRHCGYGGKLLDFCKDRVRALGGEKITLDYIEENTRLKSWYIANGFVHTGTQKLDYLPFTSGFMEWRAAQ